MAETRPAHNPKQRADMTGPERTRGGFYFTPRVDIYENDNELTLYADIPGVQPDDVDLRYERGELVLHARVGRHEHPGHALLTEYDEGDFYRAFTIHESIDAARIEAECKNGVLTVHLPKAEAARPRQVKVRSD
jgi:HSP20 family protein